jgi:hypothetical protein
MMPDHQPDTQSDPAKAFEDLRAEVSVLRKAVEALPEAIRDNRPPDYAQDLAVIGKGLDEIGGQLETIQKFPALRMTPEQQGQSIANAGSAMIFEASKSLERATIAADNERYNLSQMIGTLRAKSDQRFWVAIAAWVGLMIGFVTFPFFVRALPFGIPAGVAAIVMNANEWDAGIALMKDANPGGWALFASDGNLVSANRDKITACRAAAMKSKKEERCTITVQAAVGQ